MKISVPTLLFLLFVLLVLAAAVATAPAQSPAQDDELESFVPTEKLPADSAISFPVDI